MRKEEGPSASNKDVTVYYKPRDEIMNGPKTAETSTGAALRRKPSP